MKLIHFVLSLLLVAGWLGLSDGLLYPRDTETRLVHSLNGIWSFRLSPTWDQEAGFRDEWFSRPLVDSGPVISMPVPASYNDVTQNKTIRDYIGWVWYEREFILPSVWPTQDREQLINFGSVHYETKVWLNGIPITNHTGGHLPFQSGDVTQVLHLGGSNRLTVAVNNTLTSETIPPGKVTVRRDSLFPSGLISFTPNFDFFNYAGIHRSVVLYSVPKNRIEAITLETGYIGDEGFVNYTIRTTHPTDEGCESADDFWVGASVWDKTGRKVADMKVLSNEIESRDGFRDYGGNISIPKVKLWWPFQMDPNPGYLYTFRFTVNVGSREVDVYSVKSGIRTIYWRNASLLINDKPVYLKGFGKHEDSAIRGKGLDEALIVKDFNLIKWLGANSFRTSHYPYSEELMDHADAEGILVIDECPAVGLFHFDQQLLSHHKKVLTELVERDRNRPSVVAWSIANEPSSNKPEAGNYFGQLADHVRSMDSSRPVTMAINQDVSNEQASPLLDLLMINRYYAWYGQFGQLEAIVPLLNDDIRKWRAKYPDKPIMMSEYGADTVDGLHTSPSRMFTEDYQTEYIMNHHKVFDKARASGGWVGEHIWNFADFMTMDGTTRVVGNKKGILTRDREPKASAHLIRCRYWALAELLPQGDLSDMYCPVK